MIKKWERIVEALLFAADRPLSLKKIVHITGLKTEEVKNIIKSWQEEYNLDQHSFFIQEVSGGFTFAIKPEYSPWIKKLFNNDKKYVLSKASIETLAIIAYNQPITRMEIEKIRGVDCSSVLLNLLKSGFIKIKGKKKIPGNPYLYRVTDKFLLHFGLKSISDLPSLGELEIQNGENKIT